MFEKNINNKTNNENELVLLKNTIDKSFSTLEYCITQDVSKLGHINFFFAKTKRTDV